MTPTDTPTNTPTPDKAATELAQFRVQVAATAVALASIPPFRSETIVVPPGRFYTFSFPLLHAGQTLEGRFSIAGGNGDVGFRVETPSGSNLVVLGRVYGPYDFHYRLAEDGSYRLIFDNTFSTFTNKVVNLSYRSY